MDGHQRRDDVGFPLVMHGNQIGSPSAGDNYMTVRPELATIGVLRQNLYSPAAKSKNISLCGEIMKFGTLVGDPCKIIFRLGPNSETPPGGRHLEF